MAERSGSGKAKLAAYRAKRDFTKSPEPSGAGASKLSQETGARRTRPRAKANSSA